MNKISEKSSLLLKDVLETAIKSIELKKLEAAQFFEQKNIELIQLPMNKEIEVINKFINFLKTDVNKENILKIELDDYLIAFSAIDDFINKLHKMSNDATFHSIQLVNIHKINFNKKINDITDAKNEFSHLYNKVKWDK